MVVAVVMVVAVAVVVLGAVRLAGCWLVVVVVAAFAMLFAVAVPVHIISPGSGPPSETKGTAFQAEHRNQRQAQKNR